MNRFFMRIVAAGLVGAVLGGSGGPVNEANAAEPARTTPAAAAYRPTASGGRYAAFARAYRVAWASNLKARQTRANARARGGFRPADAAADFQLMYNRGAIYEANSNTTVAVWNGQGFADPNDRTFLLAGYDAETGGLTDPDTLDPLAGINFGTGRVNMYYGALWNGRTSTIDDPETQTPLARFDFKSMTLCDPATGSCIGRFDTTSGQILGKGAGGNILGKGAGANILAKGGSGLVGNGNGQIICSAGARFVPVNGGWYLAK